MQRSDVETVLWRLTFEAHEAAGKEGATLTEGALRAALAEIHPTEHQRWAWADKVVALMRERGGLLVSNEPGRFSYPHRSFQEFLAARHLVEMDGAHLEAGELAASDVWGEVILLACGYLKAQGGRAQQVPPIVNEVLGSEERAAADGWERVLLAGRAWCEFGPHRAKGELGDRLKKEVPHRLTVMMKNADLPARRRLAAGDVLGDMSVVPEDDGLLVRIPDTGLAYAFRIGRYPVTNAQLRLFVEAGGYDRDAPWWDERAREELERYHDGFPEEPWAWRDKERRRANLPAVALSWYEASAYCQWLEGRLRSDETIGPGEAVRLPTVEEWARVADGAEGRLFPWGSEEDPSRCNCKAEGSPGRVSPVGMYPEGATPSPEGVFDLAGNVWEWCLDDAAEVEGTKRLIGGSYFSYLGNSGSSARDGFSPGYWDYDFGFRVCVVPSSRATPES